MALTYRSRRWLALLLLLVWLPLFVVVAVNLVDWMGRPPFWAELLLYVGLGLIWALPFKPVFKGIGQADPDAQTPDPQKQRAEDR